MFPPVLRLWQNLPAVQAIALSLIHIFMDDGNEESPLLYGCFVSSGRVTPDLPDAQQAVAGAVDVYKRQVYARVIHAQWEQGMVEIGFVPSYQVAAA